MIAWLIAWKCGRDSTGIDPRGADCSGLGFELVAPLGHGDIAPLRLGRAVRGGLLDLLRRLLGRRLRPVRGGRRDALAPVLAAARAAPRLLLRRRRRRVAVLGRRLPVAVSAELLGGEVNRHLRRRLLGLVRLRRRLLGRRRLAGRPGRLLSSTAAARAAPRLLLRRGRRAVLVLVLERLGCLLLLCLGLDLLARGRLARRFLGLAFGRQRLGRLLLLARQGRVGDAVEHALDAHPDALADERRRLGNADV